MKKKSKLSAYALQTITGVLLGAAAIAAALLCARLPGSGAQTASLPETNNVSAVDALLEAREESRFQAEEDARRTAEENRREEEASSILAAAEEGYHEHGWQSSEAKDEGNGDPAVWNKFRDYAFLGDSRAVGFSYYHFLEYRRVLASGGDTIRRLPERYEELKTLQPTCLFFCYGLNDAGIGYWSDAEVYAEEYMGYIEEIRAFLPDAVFVVSSTLPVTDKALSASPSWKKIELFNAALAVACPAHNVAFVNNDGIAAAWMETLWGPDGVHLREEFYPYWANNLMEGLRNARAGAFYGETTTAEVRSVG